MKKAIILLALLAIGLSSAVAQTSRPKVHRHQVVYYISGIDKNSNNVVVASNGQTYNLGKAGHIWDMDVNYHGVWTAIETDTHSWDKQFSLYNNEKKVKDYAYYNPNGQPAQDVYVTSFALKCNSNDVGVCLVYNRNSAHPQNPHPGYKQEYQFYGEINQKQVFRTDWETKKYNYDNFTKSQTMYAKPWIVTDCDVFEGKLYATGYCNRKYTKGANKAQYVRECARVWRNGENLHSQFDNQTSHANAITVVKDSKGSIVCHTAGDHRGTLWAWHNSSDVLKASTKGQISKLATVPVGNEYKDFYVFDNALYNSSLQAVYKVTGKYIQDVDVYGSNIYLLVTGGNVNQVICFDAKTGVNSVVYTVPETTVRACSHLAVY